MAEESKDIISTGRYLVSLLRADLMELDPPEKPDGISFEDVFSLARKHGVETMSGQTVFRLERGPDADLAARWKKSMEANRAKNMVQRVERDRILEKLEQEGIDVLPLKGSLMIEMYPRPDQRQMSDLDMLIRIRDQERVRDSMQSLGYQVARYQVTNEDTYSMPPFMHVEMHHDLFTKTSTYEKLKRYYADAWSRSIPDGGNGYRYRFSWEDFYIYLLAHFYKHFCDGGSGIRNILDIYVFLEQYGDRLDEEYLHRELSDIGLLKFREQMEALSNQWFGSEPEFDRADEENERTLYTSGAYGLRDVSRRGGLERLEERYSSPALARAVYISRLLFPSYDRLIAKYPKMKGHRRLLPFLWLYHIGYKILYDRERITGNIRVLRQARKKGKSGEEEL